MFRQFPYTRQHFLPDPLLYFLLDDFRRLSNDLQPLSVTVNIKSVKDAAYRFHRPQGDTKRIVAAESEIQKVGQGVEHLLAVAIFVMFVMFVVGHLFVSSQKNRG